MRFYVLAKCIDTENGNIAIDFEQNQIKKIDLQENLEEDQTYVYANGELIKLKNIDWSIRDTYLLAFQRIRKINMMDYRFVKLTKQDKIGLDENFFIFKEGNLLGRLVNQNEIDVVSSQGLEKAQKFLNKFSEDGMSALVKGKKIYRIFTAAKLKSILAENDKQISIQQYLTADDQKGEKEIMRDLQEHIVQAHARLETAMKIIKEKASK
ncbi:hypothetical protein [Geosporobacter ferrireducens]|uniref:Uncharacterized protein n=1 Tax=Geosporobacter ferrireducens TaxID=1424294 RepID=A0A1D8GCA8_9FIRM|nr:hypothetical protein [Geosporobacter ferrireducens]AOT68553.1 hypothetical protein Gferi_02450 [Geosporobacter ferrireducens]MTI54018.1 hypothetical protein [Geosporobacter ferrireducens]